MSSCQGELAGKSFEVTAVDPQGNALINETVTALRNGFIELWLPRNLKVELNIKRKNLKANGIIETFDKSKTCVTTFRLQ